MNGSDAHIRLKVNDAGTGSAAERKGGDNNKIKILCHTTVLELTRTSVRKPEAWKTELQLGTVLTVSAHFVK